MRKLAATVFEQLGYTLSLPERTLRSVVAVAAGATKIVTDSVLPRALRKSRTWAALAGNAQRFMIERVGEVEGAYAADTQALPEDYVPRKVAGNVLEAAGIFSVHLSPLWVFAIAADAMDGGRAYLERLTAELRRDGVIDAEVKVDKLDDVLAALGKASENSARVFDTPPLSAADVKSLRDQIVHGYGQVFRNVGQLMPRIDELWARMQKAAGSDAGLTTLAGVMSMDLGQAAGKAVSGALALGRATTGLLGEKILSSYAESLADVEQRGLLACAEETATPYVKALVRHYSTANLTWTQRLWRRMGKWLGLRTRAAAPTTPATSEGLEKPRQTGK